MSDDGVDVVGPPGAPARPAETPVPATLRPSLRLRALATWLVAHPDAGVAALGEDALPTPIPDEVQLGPGHAVWERSLLDLVVPGDRGRLATAYVAARRDGQGTASARLTAGGRTIDVHYLDLRPEVPVCIRVHVEGDGDGSRPLSVPSIAQRARFGIIEKDEAARVVAIDAGAVELLGWDPGEVLGRSTLELIHPDDQERAQQNWWSMLLGNGRQVVRVRYRRSDGSWLWLDTSNSYDEPAGAPASVTCQIIDVSGEMAAADALRRSEQLLRRLTETVPVGLCFLTTDREVSYLNPRLEQLLATAEVRYLDALDLLLAGDGAASLSAVAAEALDEGCDGELDVTLAHRGRSPIRCRVTISAVVDQGAVSGALVCVVDVTELMTQATVDPLTGLLNRRAIIGMLTDALAERDGCTGILFVDLDTFKVVNDGHGHRAGDELLVSVAERLRAAVRDDDLVGRVGGDEFMVVCPGVSAPGDLEGVAARVVAAFEGRFPVAGGSVAVGLSVGMAVGGGAESAHQVVARADAAMYRAKRQAHGPVWAEPAGAR